MVEVMQITATQIAALLEDRIVALCFIPLSELPPHLSKLGLKCAQGDDQTIIIDNGQMTVGFGESDPISRAIQLGFAFCNHLWPVALPNLLTKVDKEWKQHRRSA